MTERPVYYLEYETGKRNTAGFKAPDDVYKICRQAGFHKVFMPEFPREKGRLYGRIWLLTVGTWHWLKLGKQVPKGAIVICQHPQPGRRLTLRFVSHYKKKGIRFVALIHDLESLRGGIQGVVSENRKTNEIGDNQMLKQFDVVICHNKYMRKYLVSNGFSESRLVDLGIFDYLSDVDRVQPGKSHSPSICIAGNLAKGKADYFRKLHDDGRNQNLTVNLYGIRYEPERGNEKLVYHGAFPPEELAAHLEGDFGLVWDGTEVSTCAGNTGEYLKYNNPHKASMYLSAGMPVIVWSQAAIADYVLEYGVGITVDNLFSLDETISRISEEEYRRLVRNVTEVSRKLRSGFYTRAAIREAVQRC